MPRRALPNPPAAWAAKAVGSNHRFCVRGIGIGLLATFGRTPAVFVFDGSMRASLFGTRHAGAQASLREADLHLAADRRFRAARDDGAGLVGDDGIAAIQDEQRAQLREFAVQSLPAALAARQLQTDSLCRAGSGLIQPVAIVAEP